MVQAVLFRIKIMTDEPTDSRSYCRGTYSGSHRPHLWKNAAYWIFGMHLYLCSLISLTYCEPLHNGRIEVLHMENSFRISGPYARYSLKDREMSTGRSRARKLGRYTLILKFKSGEVEIRFSETRGLRTQDKG